MAEMILVPDEQIKHYTELGYWGNKTLVDYFKEHVQKTPQKNAVIDPPNKEQLMGLAPKRLTYAEMDQAVDKLAMGLMSNGVKTDDVVMLQLPNISELAMLYLACARIGAIASPLPVQYRTHELNYTLSITEATTFVTVDQFQGFKHGEMIRNIQAKHPKLKNLIVLGNDVPEGAMSFAELMKQSTRETENYLEKYRQSANEVFTLSWTSGTEADPKGVPRTHNHWISISSMLVDIVELTQRDVIHCPFPMINMAGIGVLYVPWLLCGGTLVMHHPLDVPVFLQQLTMEKVTFTGGPPALFLMLLNKPEVLAKADFSSIRVIGCGSAPVPPFVITEFKKHFDIDVINIFGSNEGTCLVASPAEVPDPVERGSLYPRWGAPEQKWKIKGTEAIETKLVSPDTTTEVSQVGEVGELWYKAPSIFSGYYKRPDLTAKAFSEGFFKSGDLFTIATEDRYGFVGRAKDLIIRGGMNIAPEEIESLLQDHPKIAEVAVVGFPDERLGEKACVFVVLKEGDWLSLDEVVSFLRDKDVAVYKLPERVEIVKEIPRNPLGKILKNQLREMLHTRLQGETAN